MSHVTFETIIETKPGTPLTELIDESKFKIKIPCGKGKCGKCTCLVTGEINEPTEKERKHLSTKDLERGVRLACEVTVFGNATVRKLDKKKP